MNWNFPGHVYIQLVYTISATSGKSYITILCPFFIKSLELWVEEVEGKERDERETFVALILSKWTDTQEEHQEMLDQIQKSGQKNSSQSAVDPSRVFNLRKYL